MKRGAWFHVFFTLGLAVLLAGSFIGFIVLSLLGVPLWASAGFLLLMLSGLLISVAYPVGMDIRRRGRNWWAKRAMCRVTSER